MGAEAANPYMAGAELGLGLLGTGLGAYGSYQQGQAAQKQYALQLMAYKEEQERMRKAEEEARQQQLLTNMMSGGLYAQNLEKTAGDAYGSYARDRGL